MIPDPIERMEAAIDDLCFEQFAGVPDGQCRCIQCNQLKPVDQCHTASASPDAPLVCIECMGFDPFEEIRSA